MTKHALIAYSIGNFKDEVRYDILPVAAYHILLGRPWQFANIAIHHGKSNPYSFEVKGRSI